jgi:hypothetical protein
MVAIAVLPRLSRRFITVNADATAALSSLRDIGDFLKPASGLPRPVTSVRCLVAMRRWRRTPANLDSAKQALKAELAYAQQAWRITPPGWKRYRGPWKALSR